MLHDPAENCNSPLNFNLSSSLTKPDLVTASNSQLNLLDSSLNTSPKIANKRLNSLPQQSLKSDLLPSSSLASTSVAEKLSWKFFEQVDTLDTQLRSDAFSTSPLLNGGSNNNVGLFLSSPTTIIGLSTYTTNTNDVNLFTANKSLNALEGMHSQLQTHQQNQQTQPQLPAALAQGCNRKSNGYAINGTIQTTEILSQANAPTSPSNTTATKADTTALLTDLNFPPQLRLTLQPQPQQQQEQTAATFVFTSPTSTFKRKKQQKLLREEQEVVQQKKQQQEYCNNAVLNNGSNSQERPTDSISESATTLNEVYSIQRHKQKSIQNNNNNNDNNCGNGIDNDKGNITTPKRLLSQQQQQQQQQRNNSNSHLPLTANDTKTVINTSFEVSQPDNTVVTYASSSFNSLSYTNGSGTLNRKLKGNIAGNSNDYGTTRLTFKTHTLPAIGKTSTNSTFITNEPREFVAHKTVTLTSKSKSKTKSPTCENGCANKLTTISSGKRSKKMQASSSGSGSGTTATTAKGNSTSSLMDDIEMHLGLIGWRKKCLYTLLVLLMLLIIINLGLTLWILKVMEFSTQGMGQLKIVPGGIQLSGQAIIMDMLRASTIRSRHGQPISIESSRNFSINTRDANGMLENHLFLGHDKLECLATGFRINDTNGRNLFSVNRNEVTIGAHALRIDGEGGAIFRESIQTPHVRAEPGHELRLESPTRQLEMTAAKDINFQSRAGGIDISALEDIKLATLDGSIRLESSKIFMPNLRTVQLPLPGTPQSREHLHRVFQLCACSNGKLFLAAPHSICAGDDTTVCR